MTDEPWNRNAGKYDLPSNGAPKVDEPRPAEAAPCGEIELNVTAGDLESIAVEQLAGEGARSALSDSHWQLRLTVERVERLMEEKKGISDDIRDVFSEAKSNGFDAPALRAVIKRRAMQPHLRDEMDALIDTYECALGMGHRGTIDGGELRVAAVPVEKLPTRSKKMSTALALAAAAKMARHA